jgi:hypothetical protein
MWLRAPAFRITLTIQPGSNFGGLAIQKDVIAMTDFVAGFITKRNCHGSIAFQSSQARGLADS